jgi:hypothetical protein
METNIRNVALGHVGGGEVECRATAENKLIHGRIPPSVISDYLISLFYHKFCLLAMGKHKKKKVGGDFCLTGREFRGILKKIDM